MRNYWVLWHSVGVLHCAVNGCLNLELHHFPADFRGLQEDKLVVHVRLLMNPACLSNRKERPISLGIFPLPAGDALLTPEAQKDTAETPAAEHWKFHELSQPRSHTSLKVSTA